MRKMFWMFAVMVGVAYALDPGDMLPAGRKQRAQASVPIHSSPVHSPVQSRVKPMPGIQRIDVQARLHEVRTALHIYFEATDELPTDAEGLRPLTKAGYLTRDDIVDPWGREFSYRAEQVKGNAFSEEFEVFVWSAGPDGIPDTTDDIFLD